VPSRPKPPSKAVSKPDAELLEGLSEQLFTAVVGDVLDKLGYRRQLLPLSFRRRRPLREARLPRAPAATQLTIAAGNSH
jgi:hypothetical protein